MQGTYNATMPDNSIWSIPIELIAFNRAVRYKHEFDDDIQRSLKEDTYPLFESDPYEIKVWAKNCMNWDDISHHAKMVSPPKIDVDYQDGWLSGYVEIIL